MVSYTFTPKSTTRQVFWHDPSIWIGGVVPNGAAADVILPTATLAAGGLYISSIKISSEETYSVNSLDIADQYLSLDGQLSVLGSVSAHSGASIDLAGGALSVLGSVSVHSGASIGLVGATLSAGSLFNEGNIQRSGQVIVTGLLANKSTIFGTDLTVTAAGLTNSGTLQADFGNLVVNVPSGGFTNFDGTTLTGGTYGAAGGALRLNVGGVIADTAATITLGKGGAIEAFDPTSGTYLPLQATLHSIAPSGVLSLADQSYDWGALQIDGVLELLNNTTLTADQLTIGTTGQIKGGGKILAPVFNSGQIVALSYPGGVPLDIEGPVTGPGTFIIDAGQAWFPSAPNRFSILELSTPISQDVVFSNNMGTLIIDDPASFTGTIAPSLIRTLSTGNVIILNGLSFAGLQGHSYEGDSTAGVLSLHYASGTTNLNIVGDFNAGSFNFAAGPQFLTTSPPSLQITVGGTVKLVNDTGPSSTDHITFDPTITLDNFRNGGVQLVIDGAPSTNFVFTDGEGKYTPVGLADGAHTIVVTGFVGGYRGIPFAVGTASITFTLDTHLNNTFDNLVFQNNATGGVYSWELNASGILAGGDLGVPGSTWKAADASGDYNGDGLDDIIFQNATNGEVYLWLQNGFAISSQGSLGVPGVAWQIAKSGDINGDSKDDLLFQNTGTGEIYAWLQNGLTTITTGSLGVPGTQWSLAAAADLDGNGRDELIFQKTDATGEVYVWQQNGLVTTGSFSLGSPGAAWEIQGSGDFDANGRADLVFQNANTGEVYIWLMNGATIANQGSAGLAAGWSIVGTGDYNGDSKSDLAFQNDTTGAVYLWHMNGTVVGSGQDLGLASGWHVV